jgi:hypothetical protein
VWNLEHIASLLFSYCLSLIIKYQLLKSTVELDFLNKFLFMMRSLSNSKFRPLNFFVKNNKLASFLSVFLTLIFLNLVVGCSYYNVRSVTTSPETIAGQVDDFAKNQKYVIIHSGSDIWHLNNLEVNESDKSISGIVQEVGATHVPKKARESRRTHKNKGGENVLNEVHFYITSNTTHNFGNHATIPFSEINSISVNDVNTGRTILNIVGGIAGTLALLSIIVALTKSSCPFIYVDNGEEFVFTGELYPGIITANQMRDDYLLLPNLNQVDNEYSIKITNELKEIQHTDFVQLMEIEHAKDLIVLLDKNGNPHTFSNIISPTSVQVDNMISKNKSVLAKDDTFYLFNSQLNNSSSTRNIELSFNKPHQTDNAKLFLTVKNSMWLDYVFGKFNEQFGTYYNQFQKDQQNVSAEKSNAWMNEQNIPLSVYLKTDKGWELVEKINAVGPMATRDIAVPIDLNTVKGEEVVIKLETGFMFWELDYVGIDYTQNVALDINYRTPNKAIDDNGVDVTPQLLAADNNFFVQPNVGDQVVVTFTTSVNNPDLKRSLFIKNRGYYNYIRDYKGVPNFQKLKLFQEAGAFTDFSKFEYEALIAFETQFDLVAASAK